MSAFGQVNTLKKTSSQDGDVKIPNPPTDCISSVSLNGTLSVPSTLLAVTAWDGSVSAYELQYSQQGTIANILPRAQIKHDAPALCSDVNTNDNMTVFSGGCDNAVKMWNVSQGATAASTVGQHAAPVKCMRFVPEKNLLLTGSWDKTVKVWDLRTPTPAFNIAFEDRVSCLDSKNGQALVVCTMDRKISVFDLTAGGNKMSEFVSTLNYQTRCCAMFHDSTGFAVGSIEGRVALEYFNELHLKGKPVVPSAPKPRSFAFKCHREKSDIFPVNAVHFHTKNTFLSAGSDGTIVTWDKDVRHKLGALENLKLTVPIVDAKFAPMGNIMVYAASYDWSRGAENYDASKGHNVYVHIVQASEVEPKDPRTLPASGRK